MSTETLVEQDHWRAVGDHGFGVREVTGSNPAGEPPFFEGVRIG